MDSRLVHQDYKSFIGLLEKAQLTVEFGLGGVGQATTKKDPFSFVFVNFEIELDMQANEIAFDNLPRDAASAWRCGPAFEFLDRFLKLLDLFEQTLVFFPREH